MIEDDIKERYQSNIVILNRTLEQEPYYINDDRILSAEPAQKDKILIATFSQNNTSPFTLQTEGSEVSCFIKSIASRPFFQSEKICTKICKDNSIKTLDILLAIETPSTNFLITETLPSLTPLSCLNYVGNPNNFKDSLEKGCNKILDLTKLGIIHGDASPRNIGIYKDEVYIWDFELSEIYNSDTVITQDILNRIKSDLHAFIYEMSDFVNLQFDKKGTTSRWKDIILKRTYSRYINMADSFLNKKFSEIM